MKKLLKVFIYFFAIVLLVEAAARVKLSLQTNNYRYLIYYKGIVKAPPPEFLKARLLKPIQFKKSDDRGKEVILIGTSVLSCVQADLERMLTKDGWQKFTFIDGRTHQLIEYGENSIILMETMILPAIYSDFFNVRNKIRQLLGPGLYSNLYYNSVFFLMFSEKVTGAISFSEKAKQEFIEESLPVYEKTLENLHGSTARALFINFPNYFLNYGDKIFGVYCGEAADLATKALRPLVDKYSIHYLDIYTLYNNEFKREDFTDDFHLHDDGAKKAALYIFEAIKTLRKD